jgi:hypothetical protein
MNSAQRELVRGLRSRLPEVLAMRTGLRRSLLAFFVVAIGWLPKTAWAGDPPAPAGTHPRLFMTQQNLAAVAAKAKVSGSAAASLVSACQDTLDHPTDYAQRGGADGDAWPGSAMSCAFAYLATQNASFLTQAIKYWNAALDDDQMLGDGAGCTAGVDTKWQSWDGTPPAPPVIITVTHDTGYPMRWYGPYVALTYDWLYGAPGVDDALRAHTRMCLENWVDYYTDRGYHKDEPGANYNAGYVIGKTLAAIAISADDPTTSGHLWTETLDDVFQKLLIGQGLAGAPDVGTPAGVMLGGDWGEGWQYGVLSVAEYAAAARALADNGAAFPEMSSWANTLPLRYVYATVPSNDGQYVGGDFDSTDVYRSPPGLTLDAVLLGPSDDQAAGWAQFLKGKLASALQPPSGSLAVWSALADLRTVTPVDYTAQTPAPPLFYLARGTRTLYTRTSWDPSAFWGVFESAPQVNSDHHHFSASNFVFSRGADALIVDPSYYGCRGTLPTNAVTADSSVVIGTYAPSQTPWSEAELLWARGTSSSVFAARSDFANAFIFDGTASDIPYARRDWVLLPEGEVVVIDRVHTSAASRGVYVNFHANTGGTLALSGGAVKGTVGSSEVVIHAVTLSGGTPSIVQPPIDNGNCYDGSCTTTRFPTDEYSVTVPGPWAVAIHAFDGLGAGETPATVGSLRDAAYDPAGDNGAILGAAVYRASTQTYVIASSAKDGAAGSTLAYSVPGGSAARHVVFDAPEDGNGQSTVAAAVQGDRCAITMAAGAGFAGHPVMFSVSSAADGCAVQEDTGVAGGQPPPPVDTDGGIGAIGGGSSGGTGGASSGGGGGTNGGSSGGAHPDGGTTGLGFGPSAGDASCGCRLAPEEGGMGPWLVGAGSVFLVWMRRRARRPQVRPKGGFGRKHRRPQARPAPKARVTGLLASALLACSSNGSAPGADNTEGGPPNTADGGAADSGASDGALSDVALSDRAASDRATPADAGGADATRADGAQQEAGPSSQRPTILSFTATPPNLPAGGGPATLSWQVQNATSLSIDQGVGAVTGTSTSVQVTATTVFTLTATNVYGSVSAPASVSVGKNPSSDGSRFVAMVAPTSGESFVSPATLRLIAVGVDPNVDTNSPVDGKGDNASQVQFFVDDQVVLTVDGTNAEYCVFKGFASGVATGQHRVWARATYVNPAKVLDSEPRLVTVSDPPTYMKTIDLAQDVDVGASGYSLTGSAAAHIRLNGHGHRIASSGTAGALTLQFVDAFDLGDETDTSKPGIDVTTTGNIVIEDSLFDTSNTVSFSLGGTATASVRRNTFRSNMRMPLGQEPDAYGSPPSYPVLQFAGASTGAKVFAGNNVGAGWVAFDGATDWVVGGATDADSNVLIGPRVGIHIGGASKVQVRRNYSHHVYYGGWSQGNDLEMQGAASSTVEHNVIYGSSWPVRGGGGVEFRYNLVLEAGHEWMQPEPGGSVHHNVFVGGDNDVGGFYAYNDPPQANAAAIRIYNNTIDPLPGSKMSTALLTDSTTGAISVSSNAFVNIPAVTVINVNGAGITADYNGFLDSPGATHYSDGRTPAHDVTGTAKLSNPPTVVFSIDEYTIWTRATTAADVLSAYRAMYTPATGSPLVAGGDPAITAGNWIGAVGSGQATDSFGRP